MDGVLSCLLQDGVEQCRQDQERQSVARRLGRDQEDLPRGRAAVAGEGNHEGSSGQEVPLLTYSTSTPPPNQLSTFKMSFYFHSNFIIP